MHLDRTTRRLLGALVEKRLSTPEQYPLTLNALVLACNQKSNRDPEMQLEEFLVEGCLRQLRIDGWVTVVERDYGRAVRYAERLAEKLGLNDKEAAVLAELMLRGPQTDHELPRRCERMVRIAGPEEAAAILDAMAARSLVLRLPRETGQRIARWRHLLTPPDEEAETAARTSFTPPTVHPGPEPVAAPAPAAPAPGGDASPPRLPVPSAPADEVAALRREVAELRTRVDALTERVGRLTSAT